MSSPVSIVIPSLADLELLHTCLAALVEETERRQLGDEVLVVDDSGEGALGAWLAAEFPAVKHVQNPRNLGFAQAALAGAQAACHEQLFLMNPDVHLASGAIAHLQETLERSASIAAVAPFVLLNGVEDTAESLPLLVVEGGLPRIERANLKVVPGQAHPSYPHGIPVAFALGGACLMRRAEFVAAPFDPRFEPFYWEDVDRSQCAMAAGREILVDPRAIAEHHHRGTIRNHVPDELVRAAIEKNRLLFAWKHLGEADLAANLHTLAERAIEHTVAEDREELLWLALALEQELGKRS